MAITRKSNLAKEEQATPLPPPPPVEKANSNNNNEQLLQQQQPIATETVSNYEQTREQRIKENRERLQKLGIVDLSLQLKSMASTKRTPRSNFERKTPLKSPSVGSTEPSRRSSRLQNAPPVTYTELKEEKPRRSRDIVLEEGAKPEVYTEEHEKLLGNTEMPWTFFVDGYRADGTRIYDPVNGKTCHQCRQKTLGQRTSCSKCDLVRGQFCGDCLLMRYGEHVVEANQNPNWVCPPCRGICNCSLCRVGRGWAPTGALYKRISSLGFKSVAHYLIMTKRVPPESVNSSDAPQSAKRALPFQGMDISNGNSSDDKAVVVWTESNPQSEIDSTTVVESNPKPRGVGRPRKNSEKEKINAGEESNPKSRGVGRPRKRSKTENTDASEESVKLSAESDAKSAGPGRASTRSKKENIDAGEESVRVNVPAEDPADFNTNGANESNSKLVVGRSTRKSKKENAAAEETVKTSATTGDEPVSAMKSPNSTDSKADSIARRLRSRNRT